MRTHSGRASLRLVRHPRYFPQQASAGEGFLDVAVTWIARLAGMVGRKSADEDNSHIGPKTACLGSDVDAIEVRTEVNIRDQYIRGAQAFRKAQGFKRVAGIDDFIAGVAERLCEYGPDEIIVVHEQDDHGRHFRQCWEQQSVYSLYATRHCLPGRAVKTRFRHLGLAMRWEKSVASIYCLPA
jgi:hypothetical protein